MLRQVRPDVKIMANHLLHRIPQLRWAAIAEMPRAQAVAGTGLASTVLLLVVLVLGVGALAFFVGIAINRFRWEE